eukprot:scaffold24649_cov2193-Cylindrotheca_fusiformis.AAC.10
MIVYPMVLMDGFYQLELGLHLPHVDDHMDSLLNLVQLGVFLANECSSSSNKLTSFAWNKFNIMNRTT